MNIIKKVIIDSVVVPQHNSSIYLLVEEDGDRNIMLDLYVHPTYYEMLNEETGDIPVEVTLVDGNIISGVFTKEMLGGNHYNISFVGYLDKVKGWECLTPIQFEEWEESLNSNPVEPLGESFAAELEHINVEMLLNLISNSGIFKDPYNGALLTYLNNESKNEVDKHLLKLISEKLEELAEQIKS